MSERTLLDRNLRRETWCRVDADPRQSWNRAERRHFREHLRTDAALRAALAGGTQRGAACDLQPPPLRIPERKHFHESHKSHLV